MMVVVIVVTAIGALMVGIFVGRRTETAAQPQPRNGAAVIDLVQHNGLALLNRPELAGPPASELSLVGGGGPAARTSDESEAVRLDGLRRDFVANVSHELKTPVGAEAVLDAADELYEVRRFATKILNEANRLGTLVTELIALSRLQGADRLPELATVEGDKVVQKALDRCRLAAESANIRITVDPPSGLLLDGDATLLVTALSNLLDNAVSYSQPGSPVSVSRRAEDGFVEIAVTDRGLGIAPEH